MLFFKKKEIINELGFTIAEAVVTVGIITIMTAVYLVDYRQANQRIILDQAAAVMIGNLRLAQNMAMNVKNFNGEAPGGGYGINISAVLPASSYTLFADCDSDHIFDGAALVCIANSMAEKVSEFTFDKDISISAVFSANNIVFEPPSPIVYFNGLQAADDATITLQIGVSTKTITINGYTGNISAN